RSTKFAGFCCTAEESSTCAMRPPARPRSNVPGGGLRKPSANACGRRTEAAIRHLQAQRVVAEQVLMSLIVSRRLDCRYCLVVFIFHLLSPSTFNCKSTALGEL